MYKVVENFDNIYSCMSLSAKRILRVRYLPNFKFSRWTLHGLLNEQNIGTYTGFINMFKSATTNRKCGFYYFANNYVWCRLLPHSHPPNRINFIGFKIKSENWWLGISSKIIHRLSVRMYINMCNAHHCCEYYHCKTMRSDVFQSKQYVTPPCYGKFLKPLVLLFKNATSLRSKYIFSRTPKHKKWWIQLTFI